MITQITGKVQSQRIKKGSEDKKDKTLLTMIDENFKEIKISMDLIDKNLINKTVSIKGFLNGSLFIGQELEIEEKAIEFYEIKNFLNGKILKILEQEGKDFKTKKPTITNYFILEVEDKETGKQFYRIKINIEDFNIVDNKAKYINKNVLINVSVMNNKETYTTYYGVKNINDIIAI